MVEARTRLAVVCFVVGASLLFGSTAGAHRPIFSDGQNTSLEDAVHISDPLVSWALYGELTEGDTHYYRFEGVDEAIGFFAQMTTPKRDVHAYFDPWFALIGSGLPMQHSPPFSLPKGKGALLVPATEVQDQFFEPFTQTTYLLRQKVTRDLEPGFYYIAVFHPDDEEGKYSLTVGQREEWSWRDALEFPIIWFRVRIWYNPEQTYVLLAAALLLGLVAVYWFVARRRLIG